MRYPFIRAWYLCAADIDAVHEWNGDEEMIMDVVRRAREDAAPHTATYFCTRRDRWVTIDECPDPVWKSRVTSLARAFNQAHKRELAS